MKPLNKLLRKSNNSSEKSLQDNKSIRTKTTGNTTDRKNKDWREWQNVKKLRNEELIRQVELNNVAKVRELLNLSLQGDLVADVNSLGPNEMTPLHLACKMGLQQMAQLLLSQQADLECRNKACKTPLHYACQYNRYHLVKLLLAHKANYLSRDINDNTPLHLSVEMGQRESTEYMLSRFGYKQLKMKNKIGKYPHELSDTKLFPLFQEYEGSVMNKMQVYDIKEENVKKMFNNKGYEQNMNTINKPDHYMNLDKRIHKILDSIRTKKEPSNTPDLQAKKDSYKSTSSTNTQNKSMERDNQQSNNQERSTNDTLNSNYQQQPDSSIKNTKNNIDSSNSNMSEDRSNYDSRDSNESKNLSDKFKAKRNIINCANKTDKIDTNRPYSAPVKKQTSQSDRGGKEKSDQYQFLKKKQAEDIKTPRDSNKKNITNGFDSPVTNIISKKSSLNSIEFSKNDEIDYEEKKIQPEDFVAHMVLGKGSFGEVYLVQKKGHDGFQAMKVLRKQKIMGRNLTRQAKTERNILTYVQHPFIVELFYAFQTSEKLFLIMEYCPCGDLGQILHKLKKFDENTAKFYIAEILLAIEHLHSYNIIQRDLKPDNVVLDKQGHAKLTDFGLSKEEIDDNTQTSSFCGSVAQLAPEMLNKSGHGKSVDWQLLGVLLYEMLNGIPPYFDQDRDKMFEKIKNHKLKQHQSLSPQAIDILKQLLERNPAKRLGSEADGEEIRRHPFFEGIDWNYVNHKKQKPPLMINKKVNLNKNPVEVVNKDPNNKDNYVDGWSFINPSVD